MLTNEVWVNKQLEVNLNRHKTIKKLIGREESKIHTYMVRIQNVEDGFDGDLYTLEEAMTKKKTYQQVIDKANAEIARLNSEIRGFTQKEVDILRQELRELRDKNLRAPSFNERVDLVSRLGLEVFPSEDLKTRRISCRIPLKNNAGEKEQVGVAKSVFGRPYRSRTCDTLIKSHGVSVLGRIEAKMGFLTP